MMWSCVCIGNFSSVVHPAVFYSKRRQLWSHYNINVCKYFCVCVFPSLHLTCLQWRGRWSQLPQQLKSITVVGWKIWMRRQMRKISTCSTTVTLETTWFTLTARWTVHTDLKWLKMSLTAAVDLRVLCFYSAVRWWDGRDAGGGASVWSCEYFWPMEVHLIVTQLHHFWMF